MKLWELEAMNKDSKVCRPCCESETMGFGVDVDIPFLSTGPDGKARYVVLTEDGRIVPIEDWL
jgi:hypothetical protein